MSTGPVKAFKILEATVNSIKDLSTGSYEPFSTDEDSALKAIKISTDQYLHAANKISRGGDTKDVSDLHLPRAAEIIETIDSFGEDVKPGDLINWNRTKELKNLKQQEIHQVHIFNTLDSIFLNFNKLGESFAKSELAKNVNELKGEAKGMLKYFSDTFSNLREKVAGISRRWNREI